MGFFDRLFGKPKITPQRSHGLRKNLVHWCENPRCDYVVELLPGDLACPACGHGWLISVLGMRRSIDARIAQMMKRRKLMQRGERNDLNTLTEMRAPDEVRKAR